jgi:hypothetical protein
MGCVCESRNGFWVQGVIGRSGTVEGAGGLTAWMGIVWKVLVFG